jgi:hypothetical protein
LTKKPTDFFYQRDLKKGSQNKEAITMTTKEEKALLIKAAQEQVRIGALRFCRKLKSSRYKLRKWSSSDTTRPLKNKIVSMGSSFQWCPFAPA